MILLPGVAVSHSKWPKCDTVATCCGESKHCCVCVRVCACVCMCVCVCMHACVRACHPHKAHCLPAILLFLGHITGIVIHHIYLAIAYATQPSCCKCELVALRAAREPLRESQSMQEESQNQQGKHNFVNCSCIRSVMNYCP